MKNRAAELHPNYRCTLCKAPTRGLDYCFACDTCDQCCRCLAEPEMPPPGDAVESKEGRTS